MAERCVSTIDDIEDWEEVQEEGDSPIAAWAELADDGKLPCGLGRCMEGGSLWK